jgi:hypothetical protein
MHFVHGNSLAAWESHAAVDRDGIADMRDVKHDREYGSFRELLSAVAVALKAMLLNMRLYPDMFPLLRQLRAVTSVTAQLAGAESRPTPEVRASSTMGRIRS